MCVHTVKEATGTAELDGSEQELLFEQAGKFSMGFRSAQTCYGGGRGDYRSLPVSCGE